MKITSAMIAAATMGLASQALAGPIPGAQTTQSGVSQSPAVHLTGARSDYYKRKHYERDCTPINGPYGYYGNPFCEGGYTRHGQAGGYEIDLTRFLRDNPYGRYRHGPRY